MESTKEDKDCCGMKSEEGICPRPLESLSEYLSKKWTVSIVITIGNFERVRFNELLRKLENAAAKIVSERLKELEKEGIVQSVEYEEKVQKVEYTLTKRGKSLLKAIFPLVEWAEKNKP
ncbi:MAG: winged helix-turn-helix transcriptional regulator [Candidatus Pacearchaeota archaeon]